MRHKYETRGVILSRAPKGEANALVTILASEVGLVRARAQGVRRSGAKLAPALATFVESELVLVRGKESWRIAGAVLKENWFLRMKSVSARTRAARVSGLLIRLMAGETNESAFFPVMISFFEALTVLPENLHEPAELLVVIRLLSMLGLDEGEIPGDSCEFTSSVLSVVAKNRSLYVARINRGITASEL